MGQGLCFSSHLIPPQLNSLALCEFLLPPITDFIYSNFDICTVIKTPQAVIVVVDVAVVKPFALAFASLIRGWDGRRVRVGHPV